MGRRKNPRWAWQQVWWPQPFDPAAAWELLERVLADRHLGLVALEARASSGRVHYLIGSQTRSVGALRPHGHGPPAS